jgi:hypothetical protein
MGEWWAAHWERVITIVGVVLGLLGLIGIYFSYKGWKRKKPYYVILSANIFTGIDHMVPNVEVKFPGYGPMIKALTVTKIAFWNAGSDTIKKADIVKGDPLTVRATTGVVFLSAAVVECVNSLNKVDCTVSKDHSEVDITFDYLDQNEGALIQFFHTGAGNADIRLHGTVMGSSPIKRMELTSVPGKNQRQPTLWMLMTALVVGWGGWIFLATGLLKPKPQDEVIPFWVLGIGLLVTTLLWGIALWYWHIPKPLSKIRD